MGHGQPVSTCASNFAILETGTRLQDLTLMLRLMLNIFSSGRFAPSFVLLKPRWDWDAWNKNLQTSEGIVLSKPCCWNVSGYGFMNV